MMESQNEAQVAQGGSACPRPFLSSAPRALKCSRRRSKSSNPEEYRIGPGHPPKEYQFKPGQSGNPKGAKRKPSMAPDLKALLQRALNEKVKFKRGEQETIMSKAAAGIHELVYGFAEGDRHARRDLIILADKLGVDLTAGQLHVIEQRLPRP
jgi:hypothetical protein